MSKFFSVALLSAIFCTSTAAAYEVRKSRTGATLRWAAGRVVVELALEGGPAGSSATDAARAAGKAFETFAVALGGMTSELEIEVRERPGDPPAIDAGDGLTTVRWRGEEFSDDHDPDALALTITSYLPSSGRIVDADILLSPDQGWTTGDACDRAYDLQGVLTHEAGHVFGLGHEPDDTEATMFPTADTCETKKRDLAATDLDGLNYLYTVVGPARPGAPWARAVRGPCGSSSRRSWRHAAASRWWRRSSSPVASPARPPCAAFRCRPPARPPRSWPAARSDRRRPSGWPIASTPTPSSSSRSA